MTERWVKMVETFMDKEGYLFKPSTVPKADVGKLLARQHRAFVRMVKRCRSQSENGLSDDAAFGYRTACNDLLAALAKQGGGKK